MNKLQATNFRAIENINNNIEYYNTTHQTLSHYIKRNKKGFRVKT
jgi:hypothetical protein